MAMVAYTAVHCAKPLEGQAVSEELLYVPSRATEII